MVRINKQTGAILAKRVRGTSEHIPSTNILSALSDNCNGMDGKYNGAMLCFWRLLRQEDDCIRLVSVASRQIQCMPQAEESALDALAMLAEDDVSTSDERICRRTRMICTSHYTSTSFDNGHKAVGPAPGYKAGFKKENHLEILPLQQKYIWTANPKQKFKICKAFGFNVCMNGWMIKDPKRDDPAWKMPKSTQFTLPNLTRWLFSYWAARELEHPHLMFGTLMYYQLRTTRMNCDCHITTHTGWFLDRDEYVRDPHCKGCLREWIPGQKGTKEARQLIWMGVLSDGDEATHAQVRLQNMAQVELCEKVINPKHYFSIGQDQKPRFTRVAAAATPAMLDVRRCRAENFQWTHHARHQCLPCDQWSGSRTMTNEPLLTKLSPPGWRMRQVSAWASKVLRRARKMEEAVERDFWVDLPRGNLHINPYMIFGHGGDLSLLEPAIYSPFSRTMAVARNVAHTLPGEDVLGTITSTLKKWITGYVACVRHWLPRIELLPFAIGHLDDPVAGPPLARALIRVCWPKSLRLWHTNVLYRQYPNRPYIPHQVAGAARPAAQPLSMYDKPAESTADLEAILLVQRSIAAEAEAEYCDVLATAPGRKKQREATAKGAMERSIKNKQVDTFGLMEAISRSPAMIKQLYTFAAFGSKPGLHSMISPYLYSYPEFDQEFSGRVRSQKITQQQVERGFKDFRYGVAKSANDDLKEWVHLDRENRVRWKASYDAVGVARPEHQYDLDEVRARYKDFMTLANNQRETADQVIAEAFPFLGRGAVKAGRKSTEVTAPPGAAPEEKQSKRSGPRNCATCGEPQKGHARVNRRLYPCKFSKEDIAAIGEGKDELERERLVDKSHVDKLLTLFNVSLEDSDTNSDSSE